MAPKDTSCCLARFWVAVLEIINLNLAIQTQPGHELKMPLGAFSTSPLSSRGLVSLGLVSSACWHLWASACSAVSQTSGWQHSTRINPVL